jgi:hypothetical protein
LLVARVPPCPACAVAAALGGTLCAVSPTWIWMQVAIVVFVVAGMIIAVVKLA